MKLWPAVTETLVLPVPGKIALQKLKQHVFEPDHHDHSDARHKHKFIGRIHDEGFQIHRRLKHPENYLPLIKGSLEQTSKGCLIFIEYKLIFSTRLFMVFSLALSLLMTLVFAFAQPKPFYAFVSLCVGIAIYIVTIINFDRQVKLSKEILHSIFYN